MQKRLSLPRLFAISKETNHNEEQAFRSFYLEQDISVARKAMILFAIPILGFLLNDYIFFGISNTFFLLVVLRSILLVIIGLEIVYIGKIKSYHNYDKIIFLGSLALIVGGGIINATRPQSFVLHSIVTIVSLLIIYMVVPLKFKLKVFLASLMTVGEALIILILATDSASSTVFAIFFCMLVANVIASLSSWQTQNYRKKFFLDFKGQQELKAVLEKHANHLSELVKEQTTELVDAQSRLIKTERLAAIGELAGMVGHDLRNPLAGIKNAVYVIRKKQSSLGEAGLSMLDTIDQAVEHADSIISDLLDYGRELNLQLEEQSSQALIDYSLLSLKIPSNITIKEKIENVVLRVDANKLQRVFVNLTKNAIEAMPKGGELEVSSILNENSIDIIFKDHGVGMSEEVAHKIFTPLFTTKAQGMGLGLAICKRFVEAHEGKITAESKQNIGSTFVVSLPIALKV